MADDNAAGKAGFVFTNNWFGSTARPIWDALIPQLNAARILEIGSYEGASACYLIASCAAKMPIELHCIDTWAGGEEHKKAGVDMADVEKRFLHNTKIARSRVAHPVELIMHKGRSNICLARILSQGRLNYFDLIYIDGSHYAPDVLSDAVLSFPLLKIGGMMIFDDYLWRGQFSQDAPLHGPKPAIDAFMNVYFHKMQVTRSPNTQVIARKISD